MSTSNWYNKIEVSVSGLTTQGLLRALDRFDGLDRDVLSNLFLKKIKKNKNFRPLVFFIGYCLAKGKLFDVDSLSENEKHLIGDVTAAIEAENIATYYINHYLDNKGDIKSKQDEKNRVLAGVLSRNVQQEIIEKTDLPTEIRFELMRLLKEIDKDITSAQIYEINGGTFDNIDQFKDDKDFLGQYFERCKKISGQFYGRSAEMGYVLGSGNVKDTDEKRKIEQFYTQMATLLQFANDIGDYALPDTHSGTSEKNFYKDYGSDFKNKRLTYPNYLLRKRAMNKLDVKLMDEILTTGFKDSNMKDFLMLMNNHQVFKDCFRLLNKEFNKEKKSLCLPPSELRNLISSSVIIVRSNKLITSLKKYLPSP